MSQGLSLRIEVIETEVLEAMKAMISWSPQLRSHTKARPHRPSCGRGRSREGLLDFEPSTAGSKECVKPFREILRLSCARCTLQNCRFRGKYASTRDRKSGKQVGCSCSIEELPTWPCQDFSDFERFKTRYEGVLLHSLRKSDSWVCTSCTGSGEPSTFRIRDGLAFLQSFFLIRETSTFQVAFQD